MTCGGGDGEVGTENREGVARWRKTVWCRNTVKQMRTWVDEKAEYRRRNNVAGGSGVAITV